MSMFKLVRTLRIDLPTDRPLDWQSHMMAPAPRVIQENGNIEVFIGGWNGLGISSIYSIELDPISLEYITGSSHLRLFPGIDGAFDENGVFPASIIDDQNEWYLSYTGFQLGTKIPHYNFGGVATPSLEGKLLERVSMTPILDRADEGLTVRAGLTGVKLQNAQDEWFSAYAAGSTFEFINGKLRPNYSVFTQKSNPLHTSKKGHLTVAYSEDEHGVGRPYLLQYKKKVYLFYTRRMRNFSYLPGVSISHDQGKTFERIDSELENVSERILGFDDEMQYFPAPLISQDRLLVFYNGNNFGRFGMGIWEFQIA
jgi:hypothetical protein